MNKSLRCWLGFHPHTKGDSVREDDKEGCTMSECTEHRRRIHVSYYETCLVCGKRYLKWDGYEEKPR